MTEWFEQDSFWETFGEFMFDTQRVGVARSEVDRMIDLMHLAPSAKVLRSILRRLLDGWSRIETHWILLDGNTRRESSFVLRLYSGSELTSLLRSVGFQSVELYGTLAGKPYDHAAERLIAVATK